MESKRCAVIVPLTETLIKQQTVIKEQPNTEVWMCSRFAVSTILAPFAMILLAGFIRVWYERCQAAQSVGCPVCAASLPILYCKHRCSGLVKDW